MADATSATSVTDGSRSRAPMRSVRAHPGLRRSAVDGGVDTEGVTEPALQTTKVPVAKVVVASGVLPWIMTGAPASATIGRPSPRLFRARTRRLFPSARTATVEIFGRLAGSSNGANGALDGEEAAKVALHRTRPESPHAPPTFRRHQVRGTVPTPVRAGARTAAAAILAGAGAQEGEAIRARANAGRVGAPLPP